MQYNNIVSGICDPACKVVDSYENLVVLVNAAKTLGSKIVLTSGSWDLKHIGHDRYLRMARSHGDFLVVGVECDERIKKKKGKYRPVVPEEERVESLAHLQYTNIVFVKGVSDEKWKLIKTVSPDTLIISKRTNYKEGELKTLEEFCGQIVVLESQAETSTTAKIRRLQTGVLNDAINKMQQSLDSIRESME